MSNYAALQAHQFAEVFKALANPNRLQIFLRLASCCPPGTKCDSEAMVRQGVGELGQDLEIDPSTVSHHLKELRRAGLIRTARPRQAYSLLGRPGHGVGRSEVCSPAVRRLMELGANFRFAPAQGEH